MSTAQPHVPAALAAAMQRVKVCARDAAQRCVDALGVAALASSKTAEREELLAAQFELSRKQSAFSMSFNEKFDEGVTAELRRLDGGASSKPGSRFGTSWQSLTLVDDREVEIQVAAERVAMTLQHECEWELRELETMMAGLLHSAYRGDGDLRNPLRPEAIGKAMVWGCDMVTERPEVRRALAEQMARALSGAMAGLYTAIVADLKVAGVRAPEVAVRTTQGPGNELGQFTNTGYDTMGRPIGMDGGDSGPGRLGAEGGPSTRGGVVGPGGGSTRGGSVGGYAQGMSIGSVDAEVMTLIRRLAMLGNLAADTQFEAGAAQASGLASGLAGAGLGGAGLGAMPANLILAHREELRRTATGSLDHMVIDVVGSLFDQILADPKVPPQMARHIARLQLPVLRAALGDSTFFSSRRHPVRRLVNRIASLGVAFDDFDSGAGKHFLDLVRELVDTIVGGDFDQMLVYEQTLDKLEAFVAEQAKQQVEAKTNAPTLLDNKESELLLQQRYTQQLHAVLTPLPMEDFLRQFLTQVWSQAMMRAAQTLGADSDAVKRYRAAGRDLVMSVQPKGAPSDRRLFLQRLPQLMKELNEGLALIGWPEAAKKDFFAKLMPAHAAALKASASLSTLDYNLLARQVDQALGAPVPKPEDTVRGTSAIPVLDDVVSDPFTAEEAARIGLVQESAIDWDGTVDIDLSAADEPEVSELDINIDGLPPPDQLEPTKGATLADHVQIGFSYRMHFEGTWHKVRLSHISPGRTFFVFTRGKDHQHAISMTARMLYRLCETGRLRAYENAYLLERATARARKQLAALRGSSSGASTSGVPLTKY
jgi:Protein of unknown function (DUF1631)